MPEVPEFVNIYITCPSCRKSFLSPIYEQIVEKIGEREEIMEAGTSYQYILPNFYPYSPCMRQRNIGLPNIDIVTPIQRIILKPVCPKCRSPLNEE